MLAYYLSYRPHMCKSIYFAMFCVTQSFLQQGPLSSACIFLYTDHSLLNVPTKYLFSVLLWLAFIRLVHHTIIFAVCLLLSVMQGSLGNWHPISGLWPSPVQHFITCHSYWMHAAQAPLEYTAVNICLSPCHWGRFRIRLCCYGSCWKLLHVRVGCHLSFLIDCQASRRRVFVIWIGLRAHARSYEQSYGSVRVMWCRRRRQEQLFVETVMDIEPLSLKYFGLVSPG